MRPYWAFLYLFQGVFLTSLAGASEAFRLYIARQYDWANKRGFHLYLQSASDTDSPCSLDDLYLILGVGDGKDWHIISAHPRWELESEYQLEAIFTGKKTELWLNGELVGRKEVSLLPAKEGIVINYAPLWAKGRAEFLIFLQNVRLKYDTGEVREFKFALPSIPLFLFEPQCPRIIPRNLKQGEGLRITAIFKLMPYPDLRKICPLIDPYGQCKYGEWDGKIKSDEDLEEARKEEEKVLNAWSEPGGYDRFGGYKLGNWREEGTGFYRVIKKNGFWWLITPEGNPCFYIGLCGVPALNWDMTPVTGREFLFEWLPPKEGLYAPAWSRGIRGDPEIEYVSFHISNMVRKYGEKWREIALELARRRLKLWGFSGIGKWGEMEGMPFLPVLHRWDVPNIARHPDIFDPEVQAKFRESLRRQIEGRKDDPYVVGWSVGNEYDEIITKEEVREILAKTEAVPAKRALMDYALEKLYKGDWQAMARAWGMEVRSKEELYQGKPNPPNEDIERMRLFYEEMYYEFVYKTIKEIDPNHLYFGFWIVPGWWESEEDWKLSAKYCDVIGYDLYSYKFGDEGLKKLVEGTKKPIFCGEFSFPPFYEGRRGFGVWEGGVPGGVKAKDDAEAGELYKSWLKEAVVNPYCVGVSWFIYRDQHITGIGGDRQRDGLVYGEHYAFGVVDIGDRPKWDLVKRMREINPSVIKLRLRETFKFTK